MKACSPVPCATNRACSRRRCAPFSFDEIGETTLATQVKLLRVLGHREVIPVGATDAIPTYVPRSSRRPIAILKRKSSAATSGATCFTA